MTLADEIRKFICEKYIYPAKRRGEVQIQIVSGDLHSAMNLNSSMPSICQVLRGTKLKELCNVTLLKEIRKSTVELNSSTNIFIFDLSQSTPATNVPQPTFVQSPVPPPPSVGVTGPASTGRTNIVPQPATPKKIAKPPQSGLATGIKPPTSSSMIPEGQIKTSTDHFFNYALKFFESKKVKTAQTTPVEAKPIPATPGTVEVKPVSTTQSAGKSQFGKSLSALVDNSRLFGQMSNKVANDMGIAHTVYSDGYLSVVDCPQGKVKQAPIASASPVKK